MKKQIKIATLGILTILTFTLVYCKKDRALNPANATEAVNKNNGVTMRTVEGLEIYKSDEDTLIADLKISSTIAYSYSAVIVSEVLSSTMNINSHGVSTAFHFSMDMGDNGYRLANHELVIEEAVNRKNYFSNSNVHDISDEIHSFIGLLIATPNYSNAVVQSLLFHNAIILTIERAIRNSTNCGCVPSPFYITEKSPFWCAEDVLVEKSLIMDIFDSIPPSGHEDSLVYNFVNNSSADLLPLDQLYGAAWNLSDYVNFLSSERTYFHNNQGATNHNDCMKGTAVGCCGNYAGCCYYSHPYCLIHDIKCWECSYWHCGWQCQKH